MAKLKASSDAIAQLPRYILEAIAFGGILLIVIYKMIENDSLNETLPIISLYVFAGYRLLPALQLLYSSFTTLTFINPSIDKLYKEIKKLKNLIIKNITIVFLLKRN